ncbi:MAG: gfo/Idh/MocA family oxidoreductase, partial [Planctomycetota bacterium]
IDVAQPEHLQDVLILVNAEGEQRMELSGQVGFKYFGQLIRDCIDGTENAMTQDHVLKAAELCVKAQLQAEHLTT